MAMQSRRDATTAPSDELEPGSLLAAVSVTAIGIACVAVGIAWPQAASSLLRLLIVLLALLYAVNRAAHILSVVHPAPKEYTPFDGAVAAAETRAAPAGLRRISGLLSAADHGDIANRSAVPSGVQRMLRDEAVRRLRESHDLDTGNGAHRSRIAALVRPPTMQLLYGAAHTAVRDGDFLPVSALSTILEDVERL